MKSHIFAAIATLGHGAGGSAWGVLGAVTVAMRPDAPEYLLVSLFVIAIWLIGTSSGAGWLLMKWLREWKVAT